MKKYLVMLALAVGAVLPTAAVAGQIGQSRNLLNQDGTKMRVTLVAVQTNFTGYDHGEYGFDTPKAGQRYFGLRFRVSNLGHKVLEECNDNNVQLAIRNGDQVGADTTIAASGECYHLLPGRSTYQWSYQSVPMKAKITTVDFIPSSQYSDTVGEWKV